MRISKRIVSLSFCVVLLMSLIIPASANERVNKTENIAVGELRTEALEILDDVGVDVAKAQNISIVESETLTRSQSSVNALRFESYDVETSIVTNEIVVFMDEDGEVIDANEAISADSTGGSGELGWTNGSYALVGKETHYVYGNTLAAYLNPLTVSVKYTGASVYSVSGNVQATGWMCDYPSFNQLSSNYTTATLSVSKTSPAKNTFYSTVGPWSQYYVIKVATATPTLSLHIGYKTSSSSTELGHTFRIV